MDDRACEDEVGDPFKIINGLGQRHLLKDGLENLARVITVNFCRHNNAIKQCRSVSAGFTVREQPVFPTHREVSDGSLSKTVICLELAVAKVAGQVNV